MLSPSDEYRRRLGQRQAEAERLGGRDRLLSQGRLLVFLVGAALLVVWWRGGAGVWWLGLPVLAFAALVRVHDKVIRERLCAERSIGFYERGLSRIEDRWSGTGETGDRFRDDGHLYANDLDLFGAGSLFQLLSIARTRRGEERLASWLTQAASPDEVGLRQQAVTELTPALDLREELSLAGTDVRAGVDGGALVAWAEGAPLLHLQWLRAIAVLLTTAAIASGAYALVTGEYGPLMAVFALEVLFSLPQRSRVLQALHAAGSPARDLDILAHVLDRLERQDFQASRLVALRRSLDTSGVAASTAIRRLHRLVELHDWQHNQFFAPFAAALLWGTHLAWAIEGWRRAHGSEVRAWLDTVGDFEALSSLSAYRYEHPDDVWPEIVSEGTGFEGTGIGHPLIPAARTVRNDVRLWGETRMLLVSGSNMSGKSTLLRTVGINTVLALAGAPVRAAALRLTPLAIGATLRIQDSLQEGRSRFYAEITRIREIANTARGPVPLLFLLDELFHGTNSHDRLAGASGVLRSLIEHGAIGLITTHDLALTALADTLAPAAVNVHFEDRFEGGEIHFDYRVKAGPVTRSNAIALMRAVGLDVEVERNHEGREDLQ
jgi:hypothetical protein